MTTRELWSALVFLPSTIHAAVLAEKRLVAIKPNEDELIAEPFDQASALRLMERECKTWFNTPLHSNLNIEWDKEIACEVYRHAVKLAHPTWIVM